MGSCRYRGIAVVFIQIPVDVTFRKTFCIETSYLIHVLNSDLIKRRSSSVDC